MTVPPLACHCASHLAAGYIGCAVKNINSLFFRNRLNAKSLLKKVRFKAYRHASKNLTEFRLITGIQHTNGFRFTTIDSGANNQWFWLGLGFVAADVSTFHAFPFALGE